VVKQLRRKPKRKPLSDKPILDDDLSELAEILDEYRLDNNAEGWFKPRWRDGWNAVSLAFRCWRTIADQITFMDGQITEAGEFLEKISKRQQDTGDVYWEAGEHLQNVPAQSSSKILYAGLRCVQVKVSNSSGGGEVYNVILKRAFEQLDVEPWLEALVLEARCKDALGISPTMDGGRFDRQRRAFQIAWRRGLYVAAYSIQPMNTVTIQTTMTILKDSRGN
jgi:hypothetical protein